MSDELKELLSHSHKTVDDLPDSEKSLCTKCNQLKPRAFSHCSVCGRCCPRMDHHCPWVHNCIHLTNQATFLSGTFWQLTHGVMIYIYLFNAFFFPNGSTYWVDHRLKMYFSFFFVAFWMPAGTGYMIVQWFIAFSGRTFLEGLDEATKSKPKPPRYLLSGWRDHIFVLFGTTNLLSAFFIPRLISTVPVTGLEWSFVKPKTEPVPMLGFINDLAKQGVE